MTTSELNGFIPSRRQGKTAEREFAKAKLKEFRHYSKSSFEIQEEEARKQALQPYADGECAHTRAFLDRRSGILVCMDCPSQYDERTFNWIPRNDE